MRVTELGPEQEVWLASPFRPSPKAALWLDWVPDALLSQDLRRRWAGVGAKRREDAVQGRAVLKEHFLRLFN